MTLPQADEKTTGASATVFQKRCDYVPGELVQDLSGIYIGSFDLVDAAGKKLGIRTEWYDAAIDLGRPKTFNDTVEIVANTDQNGRGGLELSSACYLAELFENLRTGIGFGKNVIPPLAVTRAIYRLRHTGEYDRLRLEKSPASLSILSTTEVGNPEGQWSCTPTSTGGYMQAIDFSDGSEDWYYRDFHLFRSRVCFAMPAP